MLRAWKLTLQYFSYTRVALDVFESAVAESKGLILRSSCYCELYKWRNMCACWGLDRVQAWATKQSCGRMSGLTVMAAVT